MGMGIGGGGGVLNLGHFWGFETKEWKKSACTFWVIF
jgi:hypothetical protein